MDFVFMLTRNDRTVADCLDVIELIRPLGLRHVGFKDVGVERPVLERLTRAIREMGAVSYMEVVATSAEAARESIRVAAALGVDRVLGGQDIGFALSALAGRARYLPFPGRPFGHPTLLAGTPESVAADCRAAMAAGCAGVDLLAWRATESDPTALIRAARQATDGLLLVAGSIDSPLRVREAALAGADAFTIGSAVFDGAFSPSKGSILSQLRDVLDATAL
ncbi:MAG: hypothetical protein HQL40_17950 [Alphaproteobacteria bacterium]|nr:hypothetical protein [Alphaproteobacteria bacterium]